VSKSGNVSFHLIAVHKRVASKAKLDRLLERANRDRVPLEDLVLEEGLAPRERVAEVLRVRDRHGLPCGACAEVTYLLPGQSPATRPCERCGGQLQPARGGRPGPAAPPPPGGPRPRGGPGPSGRPLGRRPRPLAPGAPPPRRPEPEPEPEPEEEPSVSADAAGAAAGGLGPADYGYDPGPGGDDVPELPEPEADFVDDFGASGTFGAVAPEPPRANEPDTRRVSRMEAMGLGYAPQEPEPAGPPAGGEPEAAPPSGAAVGGPVGGADDARFEPPPEHATPPAAAAPPDDDARFRPPDDDARFRPPDDDARFRPPDTHVVGARTGRPAGPVRPLWQDFGALITLPLRSGAGILVTTVGAFLLAAAGFAAQFGLFMLIAALFVIVFVYSYAVRVTEYAMSGGEDLPDWEADASDMVPLTGRLLMLYLACFFPALLVCCTSTFMAGGIGGLGGGVGGGGEPDLTIGEAAYATASGLPHIEGESAADAELLDLDGDYVGVGGEWTIVGLLDEDGGDLDAKLRDTPRGGPGTAIVDGYQIYDLDRVGRALEGDVRVLAAYKDPDAYLIGELWPFTRELDEADFVAEEPTFVDEDLSEFDPDVEGDLDEARDLADTGARLGAFMPVNVDGRPIVDPFRSVELVRTEEYAWPEPFDDVARIPAVYVVDPEGRIVKEYRTGVHDTRLYADVQDLLDGGDGEPWFEADLPAGVAREGGGSGSATAGAGVFVLGMVAALILVAVGAFYFPMGFLLMVAFGNWKMPFMYAAGFRAMAAGFGDYLILAGFVVLQYVAAPLLGFFLQAALGAAVGLLAIPIAAFVNNWIGFYLTLCAAWGCGRFYYANREAIGWF